MTNILFFIAGIALGFYIKGKRMSTNPPETFAQKTESELKEIQREAKEALDERTDERKDKILEFMRSEAQHQEELKACNIDKEPLQVTCNDVEKLLDVSETTAHKYLNELEKDGKIKQVGSVGRGVYYILVQ